MNYSGSKCYHEPQLALKIDGVKYFAADALGVRDFQGDLVFNLTARVNVIDGSDMPKELSEHIIIPYKEVLIPWPDGGAPLVKHSFWQALHEYVIREGYEEICIHCEAGHGRTGTALCSMLISNLGWPADRALKYARSRVCRHMVETSDQVEYLLALDYEINGRSLKEDDMPNPSMDIMIEEYYAQQHREEEEDLKRKEE